MSHLSHLIAIHCFKQSAGLQSKVTNIIGNKLNYLNHPMHSPNVLQNWEVEVSLVDDRCTPSAQMDLLKYKCCIAKKKILNIYIKVVEFTDRYNRCFVFMRKHQQTISEKFLCNNYIKMVFSTFNKFLYVWIFESVLV